MGLWAKISQRQDLLLLGISALYMGALIGSIYAWGNAQGWNAAKPMLNLCLKYFFTHMVFVPYNL